MYSSRTLLLATLAATFVTYGCQLISASITSPSDSISGTGHAISGSSDAISVSSGSEAASDKVTYERDMRAYTSTFVKSGAEPSTFAPGATRIAATHGISNWEPDSKTADAIGEGLKDAKQNSAQAQAFCTSVGLSPDLSKKVVAELK
ncbi:MAG: putative lipoprotein [Myxococcota bacterium]